MEDEQVDWTPDHQHEWKFSHMDGSYGISNCACGGKLTDMLIQAVVHYPEGHPALAGDIRVYEAERGEGGQVMFTKQVT